MEFLFYQRYIMAYIIQIKSSILILKFTRITRVNFRLYILFIIFIFFFFFCALRGSFSERANVHAGSNLFQNLFNFAISQVEISKEF